MMITDVLHRTFVSGLAALSVYGLFMGYAVHRETLAKGKGEMALKEAEAKQREQTTAEEEAKELALAEAAQAVFRKGS
ncbi:hypothetical protein EDD22DRAFT_480771 [Suillus occidentalis]|nr:hypothetical protein EDD22DRAFT_480771 [Suillus occidentalis]